ncbi:hypothetical protein BJ741DRAFT_593461 [Chytriomyces cf. hyalinus JEL632]|nr:hypothetical protein BJ741DRAFT_593461 [Chytriomyces cf. hyalinus JEL632]
MAPQNTAVFAEEARGPITRQRHGGLHAVEALQLTPTRLQTQQSDHCQSLSTESLSQSTTLLPQMEWEQDGVEQERERRLELAIDDSSDVDYKPTLMQLALVASNELLIAETRRSSSSHIQTAGGSGEMFPTQQTLARGMSRRVHSPSSNAMLDPDGELTLSRPPNVVRNQFSFQDIPVAGVERGYDVVDDAELAILERIAAERTERDRAMNEKLHAEAMLKWRQDAHLRPRLEDEEEMAETVVAARVVGGGGVSYEQGRVYEQGN